VAGIFLGDKLANYINKLFLAQNLSVSGHVKNMAIMYVVVVLCWLVLSIILIIKYQIKKSN